jgi:hypothetical protein
MEATIFATTGKKLALLILEINVFDLKKTKI